MLPGLRASHRQRCELGHGSGELDDVDPFALEQLAVIGVPLDAERAGEGVELRAVVPRRGDELRLAIFRKRPGETVGGIPMAQSQDRHSPLTHHQLSTLTHNPHAQPSRSTLRSQLGLVSTLRVES